MLEEQRARLMIEICDTPNFTAQSYIDTSHSCSITSNKAVEIARNEKNRLRHKKAISAEKQAAAEEKARREKAKRGSINAATDLATTRRRAEKYEHEVVMT